MSSSNIQKEKLYKPHHHPQDSKHVLFKEFEKKRCTIENTSPNSKNSFDDTDLRQQQPPNKVVKIDHSESHYLVFKISVSHLSHFFRIIHVPSSFNLHYFYNIVMEALDWNNDTHRIHPHYYIDSKGVFYGNTKSILQMPTYESSEEHATRHSFPHIEEEHYCTLGEVFSEKENRQAQLFYTFGKEWEILIELQSDKLEKLKEEQVLETFRSDLYHHEYCQLVYCISGQGGTIDESNMKVVGEFDIDQANKRLQSFE